MNWYVIVKCRTLNDQYECDADRTPICICHDNYNKYKKYGYEVYAVEASGNLDCIQIYDGYPWDEEEEEE